MALQRVGRWLLHRPLPPHDREEQGYPPSTHPSVQVPGDRTSKPPLTVATTEAGALIPAHDKLLVFRSLTGIDTVPALRGAGHSVRAAPNLGIYARVVESESAAAQGYRLFNLLINTCLGTQIIVAAVLTALGASNGPHNAVMGFGAVNTIIAGFLTYLKGSGLPNRLKYHEIEWKAVRELIEQREREFCMADCELDVAEEVRMVEDLYARVKEELEANGHPGSSRGHERSNRKQDQSRSPAEGSAKMS